MKTTYFIGLSIMISTLFLSCKKEENTTTAINVEFKSLDPVHITNKRFEISIYGYDPNWQDVSASLITKQKFEALQVPFSVRIDIPEDPEKYIEYLTDKRFARYYVHLDWDSDGNGKVCQGDISIDYSTFPNVKLDSKSKQNLLVKNIPSTTPCN